MDEVTPKGSRKNAGKVILIIVVILVALAIVGTGVWYFVLSNKTAAPTATTNNSQTPTATTTPSATTTPKTTTPTIPATDSKLTLNGVNVYYPKTWGTPKTEDMVEHFDANSPLEDTYKGSSATIDGSANTQATSISVYDATSLMTIPDDMKDMLVTKNTKLATQYVQKVYAAQAVTPEDLYTDTVSGQNGYIPTTNAAVTPFNPRYLYTTDKNWRGYWYVASIAQEPVLSLYMVAVMYNQGSNKVYTIVRRTPTKKETDFNDKLTSDLAAAGTGDSTNINLAYQQSTNQYAETAYTQDPELKAQVDEMIQAILLTGN